MTSQSEPTTLTLLERAAVGDAEAVNILFRRYSRPLQRWATGRLPQWARDVSDTEDLVQDAMLQTFRQLNHFEYRGQGALLGYLREAILNGIRQEIRRRGRRPEVESLGEGVEATGASPLELAVGNETLARYERALGALSSVDREAVIARVELRLSHREIAELLGKSSPDAARVAVARALVKLAHLMKPT